MNETTVDDEGEHKLILRHLTLDDYDDIKEIMDRVYHEIGGAWPKKKFRAQLTVFPDGQICIEDHGKVVAAALSVIVDYEKFGDKHTYDQITGNAYLTTHDPNGDVLYGVDVFVSPDYRSMRLGRRLYEARKELCQNLNLKAIVAGGRIPNYSQYAAEMTPQVYIDKVKKKELYDPILTFQLSNDFEVKRVMTDYLPEDRKSGGYATLLQWHNLYYDATKTPLIGGVRTSARIGCVQWQMRTMESVEEIMQQVEYFVDALSDYQCDIALFPEFFNAPLMGVTAHQTSNDAIKALAEYTEEIRDAVSKLAVAYNINIIPGSMPFIEDGELYNV
ncbi:MAG: GNAT family N-acetyltransferase, partial [Sedimenticola sp.]|nr:GNAT family N-acetyltransferase [Sedimenticola sp.]